MEDPEEHFANWREEDEENREVLDDRDVMNELFGDPNEEAEEAPAPRTTQVIDLPVEDVIKVKKPKGEMLKLDLKKLFSERGLEAVEGHISAVKIRGKGHELEDLTNICKAYEHWGHRLYPKMRFEDVLEKVEALGLKNQGKCRMEKAVLYQKHRRLKDVLDKNSDDEDAQWPEQPSEENTGQMFGDASFGQNDTFRQSQDIPSIFGGDPFCAPPPQSAPPQSAPPQAAPSQATPPPPTSLTEEQKERMKLNRLRALEKKRNSMTPQVPKVTPVVDTADVLPETTTEFIEVHEQSLQKSDSTTPQVPKVLDTDDVLPETTTEFIEVDEQSMSLQKRDSTTPQVPKVTPVLDTDDVLPERTTEFMEVDEQSMSKLSKELHEVESDIVVESKRLKMSEELEEESEILMDLDEQIGEIDPDIANEINDLIG